MVTVIPKGWLFASENIDKGDYSFVSCATAPQFSYEGFRLIPFSELQALVPERAEELRTLCIE